ncbi:benzoate/H(+) symporter BenE family transporter, partial [Rhizobium ruizarguesonis]
TSAMCAGQDAHADPKRRYWASLIAGVCYIILGLLAGAVTAFDALAPSILIEASPARLNTGRKNSAVGTSDCSSELS